MKAALLIISLTLLCSHLSAQMCPGGTVNFSSGATTFDPAWIYGCNTGTSCNGGVNFDNRFSCQPTTAMDACAPAPTCGAAANNGSNIWFKFYAAATTVTISCFQNTSFVIGVQAFSGGPTCGSLTQIGCAVAGGPSSGVNLTMTGLTVGELYYYRIFGSSGPISQRTGIYCFCGTTGLDNYVLAAGLKSFKGSSNGRSVKLAWELAPNDADEFHLEVSSDQHMFNTVKTIKASHNLDNYSIIFEPPVDEFLYYRLRYVNRSAETLYSPVLKLKTLQSSNSSFSVAHINGELKVHLNESSSIVLCNTTGSIVNTFSFAAGDHTVSVKQLHRGVYFLRQINGNVVRKVAIL